VVKKERSLKFGNTDHSGGQMLNAVCTFRGRTFIDKGNPHETADDVILRMRSDFEAHHCRENASQAAAWIVKEATESK
jgi:hypothetical protein